MDLTWLDPEHFERRDVDGAVAVLEAARSVDAPQQLPQSVTAFLANLRHGWEGIAPIHALARGVDGRAVGVLEVRFPQWDNTHLGILDLTVAPDRRRQAVGRAMLDAGVDRIRAEGRTLVYADCWDEPGGIAFATAMGLERAAVEAQRHQFVQTLDSARLDAEYRAAETASVDYELVRMSSPAPEELLHDLARMTEAINDAPTDDVDVEDEVFSPQRLRSFEAAQAGRGRRVYRLVARHRATTTLAGQTMVGIESEQPWFGEQWDTTVVRDHRGHRLGLLLKIAMLAWLREEEPQLRVLDTWNAVSNTHMIAVNDILGYQIVATAIGFQRHL